jgi:hypothetical protein
MSPDDIKFQSAMRAASDSPSGDDLSVLQKLDLRLDKREGCGKQAEAEKRCPVERIEFVRECMK